MLLLTFNSCGIHNDNLTQSINQLADLECRAINLREQRFSLANKLRFAEDSLRLKNTSTGLEVNQNMVALQLQKDSLLKNSIALADSIKIIMEDLFAKKLTTDKSKKEFNQELNKALIKKGCLVNR